MSFSPGFSLYIYVDNDSSTKTQSDFLKMTQGYLIAAHKLSMLIDWILTTCLELEFLVEQQRSNSAFKSCISP
jgi:hypothetical protein